MNITPPLPITSHFTDRPLGRVRGMSSTGPDEAATRQTVETAPPSAPDPARSLDQALEAARTQMIAQAQALGADAVVAVASATAGASVRSVVVSVAGTAVAIAPKV